MSHEPRCISLPLTQQRWQFLLLAALALPTGSFVLWAAGHVAAQENDLMAGLLICLFGLALLLLGISALIQCFLWVHFVPEGVALTLGPWTLRRIPAEELRLVGRVQSWAKSTVNSRTVLSRRSLAELAALREKQLAASPYMRSNLPYQKRRSGWQRKFAVEYLQKKNINVIFGYWDPNLLWLEHMPELDAVLAAIYGHFDIPRADFPVELGSAAVWTDPDPRHFCRGCCKPGQRLTLQFICLPFILSPLLLPLIPTSALGTAIVSFGLLALLFLLIWLLARSEYDVVHLEDDGIRLTAGKRALGLISTPEIRFIIRAEMADGSFPRGFLAVSALSSEEAVAREVARLERSLTGRRLLAAWRQLPGWEERLLIRSCSRALNMEGLRARGVLLMANVPRRAEMLA